MKFTPRTDTLALAPGTTRLVVLGDPHGDVAALRRVLALEERPGTAFVSVGDNVGYADGPSSSELAGKRPALARGSYAVFELSERRVRVQAFAKS